VKEVEHLVQGRGRIRDVRQGPDGFLYLVFETRQGGSPALMRLEPAPRR
jgi:glucose/arabinose dehydrogenase